MIKIDDKLMEWAEGEPIRELAAKYRHDSKYEQDTAKAAALIELSTDLYDLRRALSERLTSIISRRDALNQQTLF